MTLRWYYSVDASTVLEITDRVRLPLDPEGQAIGVGTHADAGSGWEGDLLIDDPAGTLARPKGYRRIYAVQDAAPAGAQVVGNWFISGVKVKRMDPWTGAARQYVVTMADENSLLSRRKWTGSDANRPSETDIVRIRWALLETELNVLSPDETYIDTTDPVTLDASDLRDSSPEDMMMAIFQRTGKEHWVKYEEAAAVGGAIVSSSVANPTVITTTSAHGLTTGQTIVIAGHSGSTPSINGTHVVTVTGDTTYTIAVNVTVGGTGGTSTTVGRYVLCYFNPNTSDLLFSTVSISNDPADSIISADNPSSLVYPLGDDAELDGAVARMASGLIVPWKSGRVYVQDTDVGDAYAYVDKVSTPPIPLTTAASATAQATRELAELATPDDEVTTPIWVQEARLNLVKAGMIVPVHATHYPDFEEGGGFPGWVAGFVNCRVKSRVVTQEGPTTFRLDLRLSPTEPTPLCLADQNDVVENSLRDANTNWHDVGYDLRGTTWSYVATNTFHDPVAITVPRATGSPPPKVQQFTWMLFVGEGPAGTPVGLGAEDMCMVNLSPELGSGAQGYNPGASPPFTVLPEQTGTFTVPSSLSVDPNPVQMFGWLATADYGAGTVTIDEGWQVCLTRVS